MKWGTRWWDAGWAAASRRLFWNNHGYLAVDFFFILSGFVVGYAYDDRWKKMTVGDFFKRRLIRLQPMVVIGALIGAVMFYFQGCPVWDVSKISVTMLLVATLMNALLIPATPGSEIRGVGEMYPLNGPSWSLFFEYIGNILYALFLRRLPTRALAALVLLAGCGLTAFAVWGPLGDICVGFALTEENIVGGSLRLLFSFSAGLLMSRVFKPVRVRGAFWIGALGVVAVSAVPRIGGSEHLWMNGLYDAACAIAVFPLIVYLGASGKTTDKATTRICKFLGDISYPLYMVHYPFIIPVLRMGQEREPHVRPVAARSRGPRRRLGHTGLPVPETVRRTGPQIPDKTLPEHNETSVRPATSLSVHASAHPRGHEKRRLVSVPAGSRRTFPSPVRRRGLTFS